MCGIHGIIAINGTSVSESDMNRMNQALWHRGPDSGSIEYFENRAVGLGHRRLAILDLSEAANQPFSNNELGLHIVYNGEVYNYLELRDALTAKGYQFRTESDTEVILAAYHAWGIAAFSKFNGMWALTIFDEKNKEILFCRDRYGVKPFFIAKTSTHILFASENKAFKNLQTFQRNINPSLAIQNLQDPFFNEKENTTLFNNVEILPAGAYCKWSINQTAGLVYKRWYNILEEIYDVDENYEKQVEQFKSLFFDALSLRLRSDVNIATALSGGLDSSSVFCGLHQLNMNNSQIKKSPKEWQQAFVMTFPGAENDETEYAKEVIHYVNGKAEFLNIEKYINPDEIEASAIHLDAINSAPLITTDGVYRAMKENGFTISMDGHGADESMFGYRDTVYELFNHSIWNSADLNSKDIAQVLSCMYEPGSEIEMQKRFAEQIMQAKEIKNKPIQKIKSIFQRNNAVQSILELNYLQQTKKLNTISYSNQLLLKDYFYNPLPGILRNFDNSSMRFGVETRMPFMDYRLIAFLFSIQAQSKIGNGFTKRILRDAMKDILPESIRQRTYKVGFITDLNIWFNGSLNGWTKDWLVSKKWRENSFFDGNSKAVEYLKFSENRNWTAAEATQFWMHLNLLLVAQ